VKNGCTYHGLSLNVAMDLTPFLHINPCGYVGLETVDMRAMGLDVAQDEVARKLAGYLSEQWCLP
jgi:lipoyl(octanoyl) transferase